MATPMASSAHGPASASRFIYGTPGFESGSVQAGKISSEGSVSAIAGSPFDEALGTPSIVQIIADARGRFLYVLNVEASVVGEIIGKPGICGFSIDQTTGALTRVPGSPIVFPFRNNNNLAIDPAGRFLFEPNNSFPSTGFDVYAINQTTGAINKTSANSNVAPVGGFSVVSPDGRFLFNTGNGMVEAFSIDPSTGQLTLVPGSVISTSGSAGAAAITADGQFLYIANQMEGTVAVFAVASDGALAPTPSSPFRVDPGAQSLALTPNGKFLYIQTFSVTANPIQTVKGYAVNPNSGSFTPIANAVVSNVSSVTVDLSGKFAYISAVGDLFTYAIDPGTGMLTQVAHTSGPSSDDPQDVVTAP
jgi:6-phosphogluconolactonase (cycloisomerase 2 family)